MTDKFLAQSGPAEIILLILQSCHSTQDLLALVSTCRHVCSVWRGNAAAALWPVWLREIPHFQDAITAARMTQLVVDAERRGELPPTRISPGQLQQRQQPALSELRAAFGLYRLSRDIADRVCHQDLTYPEDRPSVPLGFSPEDPARMPEWRARISQAVFRLLIVGAALAGVHQEPMFKAAEHPDPEIQALPQRVLPEFSLFDTTENALGEKEMAFLLQFAVCDLDATMEAQEAIFGPISQWLLENILSDKDARQAMADRFDQSRGRAGFCLSLEKYEEEEEERCFGGLLTDGRGTHSDVHLVVWELMKMFWLVDQVRPYYGVGVLDRDTRCPPSTHRVDTDETYPEKHLGPLEAAVAVYFGMFGAEKTLLLPKPRNGRPRDMITSPAVSETHGGDHGNRKTAMSVAVFFDYIFNYSGRPNHFEESDDPVAPLELRFFGYFLQRHLGLCFHPFTFQEFDRIDRIDLSFQEFVGTATIFSHDDVGDRCSFTSGSLNFADFLDGSELLTKYSPARFTRFYQQRRSRV